MIKVCPHCRLTYSGGNDCPKCGEGHPLLDVASPGVRRAYLGDRLLARTLRTYYGARSAMLILFVAILIALVTGVALAQKGVLSGRPVYFVLAAAVGLVLPVATLFASTRVVRRIARGCVGRPFDVGDIAIERPTSPAP